MSSRPRSLPETSRGSRRGSAGAWKRRWLVLERLEQRTLLSALPTLTALIASNATAPYGQSVTFTATVRDLSAGGAIPNGGTVTFSDQNGAIGTATLVNGVAAFTTSSLATGTVTVSASYGGTTSFTASATGTIETIAGNGKDGYTGNNGPATAAELSDPWGLAFDLAGDLFIADSNNNVIREVAKATGEITLVAGSGIGGYSGDNGLATAAELNIPYDIAVDSAGDVFIADTGNNVIREVVKATGDIINFAGNGTAGYRGDNGVATAAELIHPEGLAFDSSGDLFFADSGNNVIREVVKATGDIITVAGNGTAGYTGDKGPASAAELNSPDDIAFDPSGDLFIADSGNYRERELVKATGDIITVAGNGTAGYTGDNGPATAAELEYAGGIAVDAVGDLFIADDGNNRIREVVKATGDIITVAGTGTAGYSGDGGPATAAELEYDGRLAVDSAGHVFVAQNFNYVIREITPAVTVTIGQSSVLPTLTALSASTASAAAGQSVTFTATVSDLSAGGAIPNGGTVTFSDQNGTIGSATLVNGVAAFTTSSLATGTVTVSASYGGTANFAASATGMIETIAGNGIGGYTGNNGLATAAELFGPWGLVFDSSGDLYIADSHNNVVREVVKATGDIIVVAGNGIAGYSGDNGSAITAELHNPNSLAIDSSGDLFISDADNNVVREVVKATGDIIDFAGNGTAGYSGNGGPATAAELRHPNGLAFDSSGDLFIAEGGNNLIREVVKATGDIITFAGNGTVGYSGDGGPATAAELNGVDGLAFDSSGDLFIADVGNNVIREVVKATGDIITFAGNGTAGYSGDGGPATAAELNVINGLGTDSSGDLFIADFGNNVVREVVKATGDIITVAGTGTPGYSGDNGPAIAADLNAPGRVTVDSSGDLIVSDYGNNVVREVTPAVTVTIGSTSSGAPSTISGVSGIAIFGGTVTLTATVTSNGTPVAGVSVVFILDIGGIETNVGSATTNANGVAVLSGVSLAGATGAVEAVFAGNSLDGPSAGGGSLTVNPATPTINWVPIAITYGTKLGGSQLDAMASFNGAPVAGSFAYTPGMNIVLGAGSQTLSTTFTPTDSTDYAPATMTTTIVVQQAIPTITWANPADITYGAALGAGQLDATASVPGNSVPGNFVYSPGNGVVLNAGQGQKLSVTFTPTDTIDYSVVSTTATINVAPAPLVVTVNNQTKEFNAALPTLTGTIAGLQNGDPITVTYSTTATSASPKGSYPITATLSDPDNRLGNYTVTNPSGILTVLPETAYDFTSVGHAEPAVYRPTTAQWFVLGPNNVTQTLPTFGWANHNDIPVPGDYDGVGHTEQAVYRPTTGEWFALEPNGTSKLLATFGWIGHDIPVPGDYDGVGHTEPAMYRPSTGQWFVLEPNGTTETLATFGWVGHDIPVPGDYDGVDHTEQAVYRPSTAQWFVLEPNGATKTLVPFGSVGLKDLPVPGDYDGVGHTEQAVYRPSTGQWFVLEPNGTTKVLATFGWTNLRDLPVETSIQSLVGPGAVVSDVHANSLTTSPSIPIAPMASLLTPAPVSPLMSPTSASSEIKTAGPSRRVVPSGPLASKANAATALRLTGNRAATLVIDRIRP